MSLITEIRIGEPPPAEALEGWVARRLIRLGRGWVRRVSKGEVILCSTDILILSICCFSTPDEVSVYAERYISALPRVSRIYFGLCVPP